MQALGSLEHWAKTPLLTRSVPRIHRDPQVSSLRRNSWPPNCKAFPRGEGKGEGPCAPTGNGGILTAKAHAWGLDSTLWVSPPGDLR